MLALDMRTVMLGNMIVNAVCLVVMLQLWRQNRGKYAGLNYWVVDWALQFGGGALIALRGAVPNWASMVLSNGMIVGGTLVLYFGLRRFAGMKNATLVNYFILATFAVFVSVHSYFTLVQDSPLARNFNVSIGLSLACLMGMWLMFWGVGPEFRRISRGTGMSFALIVLCSLTRIVGFALLPNTGNDFLQSGMFDTLLVALLSGAIVLLVFNLVLMVNRRLFMEGKQAEDELRETGDYLNNLLDNADGPIVVFNPQFRITRFNRASERLIGLNANEVVGKQVEILFSESGRNEYLHYVQETVAGEDLQAVEVPVMNRRDGAIRTVLWSSANVHSADGKTVLATIAQGHDITARKRMEARIAEANRELRELAARLETVHEEQRAEVAWELHDYVAQALVVLKVDLDSCRRKLEGKALASVEPTMEGMTRVLDETIGRLRRLYAGLVPVMLEDLGLAASIQWQVEEFTRLSGIEFELRRVEDIKLPRGHVALGMFRVLQEALDNVQRHSSATKVSVDFERVGSDAVLRVADNGRGFVEVEARKPGAIGLTNMRERVLSWGGRMSVNSTVGVGTELEVTAPLEEDHMGNAALESPGI